MPSRKVPFKDSPYPVVPNLWHLSPSPLPACSGRLRKEEPEILASEAAREKEESFLDSVVTLATGLLSLVHRLSHKAKESGWSAR